MTISRLFRLDPFENFFSMHCVALGGSDSDSHLIPLQGKNSNSNLIANLQGFPNSSGKNEHGTTSDLFLLARDFRPERRGKPLFVPAEAQQVARPPACRTTTRIRIEALPDHRPS